MFPGLHMSLDLQDAETANVVRLAIKQAINEWLDAKYSAVGKWTVRGITVAALGAFAHFLASSNGWFK